MCDDWHESSPFVVPTRRQSPNEKKKGCVGHSLIPHSTINRPNTTPPRIIDLPPQKSTTFPWNIIETPFSLGQIVSGPSRKHDGDIIQFPPHSDRLVPFVDKFHIPRDLLFCELVRICDIPVPSDRPRRNRVETVKPNVHEFWVPVRIACRGPPMRRDYSIGNWFQNSLTKREYIACAATRLTSCH